MIAALYARKSSDDSDRNEEARSTARQVARATEYATAKGWTVDPACVYVDDGISGAEFVKRPGFLRLMAALKPRPPFQVLVISEESRLGRESIETGWALKQITDAGVQVWLYLEDRQRTLDSATEKVMLSLTNFAAEVERERAQQRTADALRRRFLAGASTGGRLYGYTDVRREGGYAYREILAAEAAVVRKVYALYAEGAGVNRLARTLDAEGEQPPRGRAWSPSAIRDMLRNPHYVGRLVYRRRQRITRGGTHVLRRRAEADQLERQDPALRIVSDDLWALAAIRLARQGETYARRVDGTLIGQPSGADVASPYLLSGLASCGRCGGSLVAIARGARSRLRYGCLAYHRKGRDGCANGIQIHQDRLDRAVLDALAEALDADVIEEAISIAVATLKGSRGDATARMAAIAEELRIIATRERRLLDALMDGDGAAEAIRGRLREELARRDALMAEREHLDAAPVDLDGLAQEMRRRTADVRAVLGRHVAQARQMIRALLHGRLVCEPYDDEAGRGYRFTAAGAVAVNGGGNPIGIRPALNATPVSFRLQGFAAVA